MKKKFIYIIIAVVAIIIALIFLLRKPKIIMEKTFKPTIEIINGTNYEIDTILLTIADKILGLDTLTIRVYYSSITIEKDGIIVNDYAVKNFLPHDYTIYIGKNSDKSWVKKIMAHEMSHVKQYEIGDLISLPDKKMKYKGEIIDLLTTDYMNRQYEKDAFREQTEIISMLNRIRYE